MDISTKIPAIGKRQAESLARVIVNKNLAATPEQCAEFYATPAGQRMKEMIAALRAGKGEEDGRQAI